MADEGRSMGVPEDVPELSVVVAVVSDTLDDQVRPSHLASCLEALRGQEGVGTMETLVPHLAGLDVGELALRFSSVFFFAVPELERAPGASRDHHDVLRSHGLRRARGEFVALLEDHAQPVPGWAAALVKAHREGWDGVGGAIENGIDRPLAWAVYFCDFHRYGNPVPPGETFFASDANVSYRRAALESVGSTWQKAFREPVVNAALRAAGQQITLSREAVVYQKRSDLRLGGVLRERFVWGRSFAAGRRTGFGGAKRLIYAGLAPLLPPVLLVRMARSVLAKGRHRASFLAAVPAIFLLLVAWSLGEAVGYFRRGTGAHLDA